MTIKSADEITDMVVAAVAGRLRDCGLQVSLALEPYSTRRCWVLWVRHPSDFAQRYKVMYLDTDGAVDVWRRGVLVFRRNLCEPLCLDGIVEACSFVC